MRLLVVEDDEDLRGAVDRRLRGAGFAVDAMADIPEAEIAVAANDYDCLVLDRAVPSGDTLEFVRRQRDAGTDVPVLFLTARDAVSERVRGFEAGADDYLVKPFAMEELVARVRRLARRGTAAGPAVLVVGDLEIDQARAEVRRRGILLTLTAKEYAILIELANAAGGVVSRTTLVERCWDEVHDPLSNTVDVHIATLRRKLGEPQIVHTDRGRGYRLR